MRKEYKKGQPLSRLEILRDCMNLIPKELFELKEDRPNSFLLGRQTSYLKKNIKIKFELIEE